MMSGLSHSHRAGAHTIGMCRVVNSGFRGPWVKSSLRFDNSYYRDLLTAGRWVYDGKQFNSVAGDGMIMLDSDMRLSTDEIFSTWARLFATNEELWFDKFSNSFSKLAELGHSSLQPVEYVLASNELGTFLPPQPHSPQQQASSVFL